MYICRAEFQQFVLQCNVIHREPITYEHYLSSTDNTHCIHTYIFMYFYMYYIHEGTH